MIPKIIHYVWVGGNPKPKNIQRCMKTWQKHLQDYQIIEWNEDNFDIHENKYVEQAYKAKKWAFVSDYIRAKAVYEMGGIYLDTDVLVLDNLESLLNNRAFVGFENPANPFTAVFGAEKHHPLLKDMLAYYDDRNFSFDHNDQLAGVNTVSVSDILKTKYQAQPNNKEQVLSSGIHVYPDGILCNPSPKSKTIHVFTGTWMEGAKPLKRKLVTALKVRIKTQKEAALYAKIFR
ncbi:MULTISPECIES: glycosyltransferase family 32 protein [Lactobacillus]|uniref:Glycosyl transferase n=1 Tax=Lactobacillus panisapium TaxID=2012495 RepID=A0ABX8W400_9LACO|nr:MULTISPECIES: glycosyltransferase [Lactobacillus]MCO6531233.1 glycosyl transferase [Lactobacillus sp.]MCX8722429.1 glycosyl transferase [Lactobacillus sp. B4005]MCX8735788.1 glycosyl transferase [Lactobacillus sp. B4026]QYN52446.1 glycosyl transferase [Lactobacillus panisapium]QYN58265.1 glycosyl transferase [Lactobacillus panisapium]